MKASYDTQDILFVRQRNFIDKLFEIDPNAVVNTHYFNPVAAPILHSGKLWFWILFNFSIFKDVAKNLINFWPPNLKLHNPTKTSLYAV